jgi:hypothetical protein
LRPPTKLQVFANFGSKNLLHPFITARNLQVYLRQIHFLFPKLKMKFKGLDFADVAGIKEAVTDE